LKELVVAYFQYYAIQGYLLIAAGMSVVAYLYPPTLLQGVATAVLCTLGYPVAWYILHRFVLHGKWMYKSPLTARTWKRVHFDHHQDPNHLEVLFGALYTTLPAIVFFMAPIGWLIGGLGGMAVALVVGVLCTCVYEFVHCIQHLAIKPKNKFLQRMKAQHMAHHFHDETGNFGLTEFKWDKLFGTHYERTERPEKSPTVFNLGYTEEEAKRYPWVYKLSNGVIHDAPPRRAKLKERELADAG
ncbi:MAG: sterol desaturase family protein, partial [Pseudomonadota bacterium]